MPATIAKLLLDGLLVGRQHGTDSDRVGRDRFLREHVLAGGDRRREMGRPESWRRGQDHEVDVGREHPFVGVEARVDVVAGHLEPGLVFRRERRILRGLPIELDSRLLEPIRIQIAERRNGDAVRRTQDVADRSGSAAAGADHAYANHVGTLRANAAGEHHRRRGRGRGLHERPPGDG